jgi:hypothetical protein
LFIINPSAGMLFGDPTLSGTMFLLATTDSFHNGLVDLGANMIWNGSNWNLIDPNNDAWLLGISTTPVGSPFNSAFIVHHSVRGTVNLIPDFAIYEDARAYFAGAVGVGIIPNPAYSAFQVVFSGSAVIADFYGPTNGNHWITVRNTQAELHLGIGSIGPTAGIPYAWSSNEKFFIGGDGNPAVFFNGVFVGIGKSNPNYNLDVNGNVNASNCYLINGAPLACTDGSGGISLSNVTSINGQPVYRGITGIAYGDSSTKAWNTVYQNTHSTPMFVAISCNLGPDDGIIAMVGQSYPPTTQVGVVDSVSQDFTQIVMLTFWVLPGWYYMADATYLSTNPSWPPLINKWIEYF